MEDLEEVYEQSCLLNLLSEIWIKRVTKEEAKRVKSNHTLKMILNNERTSRWGIGQQGVLPEISRGSACRMPSSSRSQWIVRVPEGE